MFFGVGIESMGVPAPGETALLVGVVAATQGHLAVWGVLVTGWLGAVIGDNLGYLAGRRWGASLMVAPGLRRLYTPRRVAAAERYIGRYGFQAVFVGRFIAVLRIFAGPLAGMHRLPWRRFVIANALGAALWVGAVGAVGTLIGANIGRAAELLTRSGYVGLILAGALVIAVFIRHRVPPHRKEKT